MGLFPNAMAWPRKGMLEGMYGGYFYKKKNDTGNKQWLMNDNWQCISGTEFILTYQIFVLWGLPEQYFSDISQGESDGRSCQHHGGQVIVYSTYGFTEQSTAQLVQVRRHDTVPGGISSDFTPFQTLHSTLTTKRRSTRLPVSPRRFRRDTVIFH